MVNAVMDDERQREKEENIKHRDHHKKRGFNPSPKQQTVTITAHRLWLRIAGSIDGHEGSVGAGIGVDSVRSLVRTGIIE